MSTDVCPDSIRHMIEKSRKTKNSGRSLRIEPFFEEIYSSFLLQGMFLYIAVFYIETSHSVQCLKNKAMLGPLIYQSVALYLSKYL